MIEFEDIKGKAEEEPFRRHIVFSTFFTRTTAAVFTAVNGSFGQKSRLRFLLFDLCQYEMLSLCADIFVGFSKIRHIFTPSWVGTVFLSFFLLMIGRFDLGIGVL